MFIFNNLTIILFTSPIRSQEMQNIYMKNKHIDSARSLNNET